MVDIIACTIKGARVGDTKTLFKRQRYPHQVRALRGRPGPGEWFGKEGFGDICSICEFFLGVDRVAGGGFLNYKILAVYLVVPGTTMPVISPLEVEDTRA
ncbi:hypothetical protein ES703_90384 [subsurface metagenome]